MGLYLSSPKTDKYSEDGDNEQIRYGLSSMQGWRSTMEDAHAAYLGLDASTSFFGVYDGHGGKAVSRFCAKYLHHQVLKNEAYSAGDLGTSLHKAFFRMDEMMCGQRGWRELAVLGDKKDQFSSMIEGLIWSPKAGEANNMSDDWTSEEFLITKGDLKISLFCDLVQGKSIIHGPHANYDGPTSGSTACVAMIRNNQLVVANAGDSRCVISRNGQAVNMSLDHKPELEIEKTRIMKAGGFVQFGRVNGSLNLSRAIGDMELKKDKSLPAEQQILSAEPDINTIELRDDDEFFAIACDGIWDCMTSQQFVNFVREELKSESKLSVICERVLDKCLAPKAGGEGCDNMTLIIVQLKPKNSSSSSSIHPSPDVANPSSVAKEEEAH